MNELIEQAKKLNLLLQQTPEYKTYIELEKAAKEAGLFAWEDRLKQLQQEMTIALDEEKMDLHIRLANEYKQSMADFEQEPLRQNYITAKQELNELLQEMVQLLRF